MPARALNPKEIDRLKTWGAARDGQDRLEAEPETADLVATLGAEVSHRDRDEPVGGERTARVRAVEHLVLGVEHDLDSAGDSSDRGSSAPGQRVRGVLNEFEERPVGITTGPDRLLVVRMLGDQLGLCPVGVEGLFELRLELAN